MYRSSFLRLCKCAIPPFPVLTLVLAGASSAYAEAPNPEARAARQALYASIPEYQPPAVQQLEATLLQSWPAAEAGQGAAADENNFYAIVNFVIGKYDQSSGELVDRWTSARGGPIRHLNSCLIEEELLWCAHSNHPGIPMSSSIEIFDTATMEHVRSHSLGIMDAGSLVWLDRLDSGWVAGFAHYDDETGVPFKDHNYAEVVLFDEHWRRTGGYQLPPAVLQRMAPQAASGGAIGNDGLLYVMGHDRPEMYALQFPVMGSELVHVATISLPAEGQAFAFDPLLPDVVWAISRPAGEVRKIRIERPELTTD